jgi:hypothetical protein
MGKVYLSNTKRSSGNALKNLDNVVDREGKECFF